MNDFWFYIKLGYEHVLDVTAYDHILFLSALAVPYTFKSWKQVVILATIFTIAHCTSLALSAFGILSVRVTLIEFLIPITIALTTLFNIYHSINQNENTNLLFASLATLFFGFVHGFGFSNYFNMLMAEEKQKLWSLLGFAMGIEFSQVTIIMLVLFFAWLLQHVLAIKKLYFIVGASILILFITLPILLRSSPF